MCVCTKRRRQRRYGVGKGKEGSVHGCDRWFNDVMRKLWFQFGRTCATCRSLSICPGSVLFIILSDSGELGRGGYFYHSNVIWPLTSSRPFPNRNRTNERKHTSCYHRIDVVCRRGYCGVRAARFVVVVFVVPHFTFRFVPFRRCVFSTATWH